MIRSALRPANHVQQRYPHDSPGFDKSTTEVNHHPLALAADGVALSEPKTHPRFKIERASNHRHSEVAGLSAAARVPSSIETNFNRNNMTLFKKMTWI